MNIRDVLQKIENNAFLKTFEKLYGTSEEVLRHQKQRYLNLTDDYAAIRSEMGSIAAQLGKPHLREVSETAFYIPSSVRA